MNRIMKRTRGWNQALLLSAVILAGFTACQKNDSSLVSGSLSENTLKAAATTYSTTTFDEVMEIGDETLSMFERLLHGRDSVDADHDSNRFHHRNGRHLLDSLFHRGDSVRLGDLDHLRDSLGPKHGNHRLGPCTEITRDSVGDALVVTINFGADSCTGFDGKVRLGKIIMTCTGDYYNGESKVSFAFENYYVDGNQVLGTSEITSYINAEGNRQAEITETGSIIMGDGSGTITLSSNKTRVVKTGTTTFSKKDDVIELTGTASGTLVSGNTFVSATESPLVRNYTRECKGVFVSGLVKITVNDGTEITVDYGDGTCDNVATVTTNGVSENITLEGFLDRHGEYRDSTGHGNGHRDGRRHRHGF
jgi:hypothetical protein